MKTKYKNGYLTLVSVLVLSTITLSLSLSMLILGLASSRSSFSAEESLMALALANGCAEEGLQQIRDDTAFTGTNTFNLSNGRSCTYDVSTGGGQNRTIDASGTVDTVIRRVKVTIDAINPQISVVSWQEIANF
jgi:hypothetical protein